MNSALYGLRKLLFATLAVITIIILGFRVIGSLCTAEGFVQLASMALIASLCLAAALSSARKGFYAGGVLLLAGLALNALAFIGILPPLAA